MSWHGPSAPRVEGIATKSFVVASCASKAASTASTILCLVSLSIIALIFPLGIFLLLPDQSTFCDHLPRADRFQNRGGIHRLRREILPLEA